MIVRVSDWAYNDRPDGVRFLPDRIAEPTRTEIEGEIWAWVVRGEDDAGSFVDYLDDDEERSGITDEELASAYERALDVRRAQQREWGAVYSNLTLASTPSSTSSACWRGRTSPAVAPAPLPRSTTSATDPGTGTGTSGITSKTPSR